MSAVTYSSEDALRGTDTSDLRSRADQFRDLPVVSVERRRELTRSSLCEYLAWPGRPLIITDATQNWPAMQRWSFQNIAAKYGRQTVVASPNLITYSEARRLSLEQFLLYCQCPQLSPLSLHSSATSYYVSRPLMEMFPAFCADWMLPPYIENIYSALGGDLREWYEKLFVWIFLGPANTVTPVHVDQYMTHTITTQIRGTKKFLLFSPLVADQVPGLRERAPGDLFRLQNTVPQEPVVVHEATVLEGESVVLPAGWAHHVVSLSPSITLSVNFVDSFNSLAHIMTISRHIPSWIKKIDVPEFRRGNGCTWAEPQFAERGD